MMTRLLSSRLGMESCRSPAVARRLDSAGKLEVGPVLVMAAGDAA